MKQIYKGCEIEVTREDGLIFYHAIDISNGFIFISAYTEGNDAVRDIMKYMKKHTDNYLSHPEQYL